LSLKKPKKKGVQGAKKKKKGRKTADEDEDNSDSDAETATVVDPVCWIFFRASLHI
jgi:hypothetical protein